MFALTHVNLLTPTGEWQQDATVLVDGTTIAAVGQGTQLPTGTEVLDGTGKYVTPGIIDVHTHLGVHELGLGKEGSDFNETTAAVTPQVRAVDGLNPLEKGFQEAVQAGVTTVQVMPGSANVIGGETVVLKTCGRIVDEMVVRSPAGMKAAFGENPKNVHGAKERVNTRMGIAALFRQQFMKAEDYLEGLASGKNPTRDLGLENLGKVLRREVPLRAHAHRADDIATVLRLAEEFDISVTIEHCTEGHLIADYIAAHDVRVSVGPTMSTKSKVELANKGWHTVKALADAGVPFAITTDHPVVGIEYLITAVANAVKNGLNEAAAWQSVTVNAALHLGVDDRVGSLEPGKDADLVVWSGDPLDLRNKVLRTFINGKLVYDADQGTVH